jgi:hypothetical protein
MVPSGWKMIANVAQWNLDLSFFKGTAKTNDEYGEMINLENRLKKKMLLGRILPQLKI